MLKCQRFCICHAYKCQNANKCWHFVIDEHDKFNALLCFLCLMLGAQWFSGRVLDSRPKGRGFEPHRRHCVVVLEQDTFILA